MKCAQYLRSLIEGQAVSSLPITKAELHLALLFHEKELERLEKVSAAAQNLIDQKGRHHTEIAYQRLAAALKEPS